MCGELAQSGSVPFKVARCPLTSDVSLVMPDFNDSNEVSLKSRAEAYELGYARYHNPAYIPLLQSGERHGRLAFLFGEPELKAVALTGAPAGKEGTLASRNSTASGFAILQRGSDEQATWLCLKYGPHGGAHGHPDKNNFVLYSRGQVIATDSGTHAYGSPLHAGWDKTTLAHNTLVVDQSSQKPAKGKCLAFGSEHGVDYVMADAGPIYDGLKFVRTGVLLNENLLVFVDQIHADAPHTLDIAYHQLGEWDALPKGDTWTPPDLGGYKFLKNATTRRNADGVILSTHLRSDQNDWHPTITLAGGEPTEVITASAKRLKTSCPPPFFAARPNKRRSSGPSRWMERPCSYAFCRCARRLRPARTCPLRRLSRCK